MTKRFTTKWWNCRRTGCKFDAKAAAEGTPMNRSSLGDLAAKIMQVHLLDHICDLLVEEKLRDHQIVTRALSVAERSATVAEVLIAVNEAERLAVAGVEREGERR